MKKRNRLIGWMLILVLAFSTASTSAATTQTAKAVKDSKMKVTLTTVSNTSIKAAWAKQKKYGHYEVYRKIADGKTYKKTGIVNGTVYVDKNLKKNTLYKYKVRPYRYINGKKRYGKYSYVTAAATGIRMKDYHFQLSLPETDTVGISIDAVSADCSANEKTALIYRSTSVNGPYEKIKELTLKKKNNAAYEAHFVDKETVGGTIYYYKFKVQKTTNKKSVISAFSTPQAVLTQPAWTMNTLTYSNLTDEKNRQAVGEVLRKAGIQERYISELMALATDYNDVVGVQPYFHEGFATIDGRAVDYESADTYSLWMDMRSYADVNCRLTAMTLFRDFITTEKKLKEDDFLATDTDAMDNYPLCKIKGADRSKFYTVYNPVSVGDTTDPVAILAAMKQEWKDRGVKFNRGAASLISVVCHDEMDQIAFVGHTGVMIQDGSEVYFVEKFGPTVPYQITKFQSEEQVREYLLNRFWKFYTPGVSAPPVIMENDGELSPTVN